MSQQPTDTTQTLQLRRTYNASPERLFAAWTDPQLLNQWFRPNPALKTTTEVDLREGGRYRIEMQPPEGDPYVVVGEYETIAKPDRITFSWRWLHENMASFVTVEFNAVDETSTEIVLTHEQLANEDEKNNHTQGWLGCYDRLEEFLSA